MRPDVPVDDTHVGTQDCLSVSLRRPCYIQNDNVLKHTLFDMSNPPASLPFNTTLLTQCFSDLQF